MPERRGSYWKTRYGNGIRMINKLVAEVFKAYESSVGTLLTTINDDVLSDSVCEIESEENPSVHYQLQAIKIED